MAKLLHGVIDDGTREIPLVNKFGKPICKVYIRPADFSIVDRYKALMKDFDRVVQPLAELSIRNDGTAEFEEDWKVLKEVEANLKQKINELFDMHEADEIFAKRNPFRLSAANFSVLRYLPLSVTSFPKQSKKKPHFPKSAWKSTCGTLIPVR